MSVQTYLTDNPPTILDATCSSKRLWPRFATIRMDINRDAKPELVASATHLPFIDGIFQAIYCDPPHMIRDDLGKYPYTSYVRNIERFGAWKTKSHWFKFLSCVNQEFKRTLDKNGVLKIKLTDGKDPRITKRRHLSLLTNFVIKSERKRPSLAPFSNNQVLWLTYIPVSEHNGERLLA